MPANDYTFYAATRIQSAGTVETSWKEMDMYEELIVFLELSAQGSYTDETLSITVQVKSPDDGAYDVGSFDQILDRTTDIIADGYYRVHLPIQWFGTQVRMEIVTAGTSVDYTLKLQGITKRT